MKPDLKVTDNFDGTLTLEGHCTLTKELVTLIVNETGYQKWLKGVALPTSLPELGPIEREFLTSGMGPTAWRQLFGEAEVEDPFFSRDDDEIAEEDRPKRRPGRKKKTTFYVNEHKLPLFDPELDDFEETLDELGLEIDPDDLEDVLDEEDLND